MDVLITNVRMTAGSVRHHAHIERLKGHDAKTGKPFDGTRAEWVKYVRGGGRAHTRDAHGDIAYLRVRQTPGGTHYVQTFADGIYADNLLALPRY